MTGFLMIPEGIHSWTSPFTRREEFDFQNLSQICPQGGGWEKGGGGGCFKKGVSLIFILTLSNGYIFLSVWCADDCFVYLYHFYQYSL